MSPHHVTLAGIVPALRAAVRHCNGKRTPSRGAMSPDRLTAVLRVAATLQPGESLRAYPPGCWRSLTSAPAWVTVVEVAHGTDRVWRYTVTTADARRAHGTGPALELVRPDVTPGLFVRFMTWLRVAMLPG